MNTIHISQVVGQLPISRKLLDAPLLRGHPSLHFLRGDHRHLLLLADHLHLQVRHVGFLLPKTTL